MNTIRSLRNHLDMFQQTYSNALTQESPMAQQPLHITIPLRLHQLAALERMRSLEVGLRTGYPCGEETLFSRFTVLGDRTGVGKTLMILGHVSQMALEPLAEAAQAPMSNLHTDSTAACFSISPAPTPSFDTLIIVPHIIFRQWQDAISSQTSLSACFLKTQRDLDKDGLVGTLQSTHLALISNTLLPHLLNNLRARELREPSWRRVVYDEADSIKIQGTCEMPRASMNWLVTATFPNLLFVNHYYHSYLLRQLPEEFLQTLDPELQELLQDHIAKHPSVNFFRTQSASFFSEFLKCQHPLRNRLVVRTRHDFLATSVELPPLRRTIVRCETPLTQRILENTLTAEAEAMLHAGDIPGALQSLGVSSHTPLTLIEAVTQARQKELERLRRLLDFKREEEYTTPQAKEQALANLEGKIKGLEHQLTSIKVRLEDCDKGGCGVCFEPGQEPVVVPCCSKVFCGSCILEWMTRSPTCPACRASFHPSQLIAVGSKGWTGARASSRLPKKLDALLQLLEENPDGRFLIFSRYENPLTVLQEKLGDRFPAVQLQGNKDAVAHMVAEFSSGAARIMLLSCQKAAAGLNLPAATHVILLHRMGPDEEKQILGRAYRLGRKGPLEFVQLLHERE